MTQAEVALRPDAQAAKGKPVPTTAIRGSPALSRNCKDSHQPSAVSCQPQMFWLMADG